MIARVPSVGHKVQASLEDLAKDAALEALLNVAEISNCLNSGGCEVSLLEVL